MARERNVVRQQRYQGELERSRKWRNQEELDSLWERLVDLYRGKHYKAQSPDDRLIINLAFATKNVIAPSIAVNNPRFVVNARKPDAAPHALITEEVLNYLWRTHKYHGQFRLAVDDFLCVGHGWLKVGYKFVKEPEVKEPDEGDEEKGEAPGVDDRDEEREGNVESEKRVLDDRPFIERISPFDMYVDPDARHPSEMRWIAQRIRRPVADVKVDKRYAAKVRRQVNPTAASKWEQKDEGSAAHDSTNSSEVGYVDIFEYYDLKTNTVCTFADGTEDFLIPPKPQPYAFGHPFVMLRNYEVPDHFYPIGELEQIEAMQLELNATRTQQLNHRKRYARKYLYDESFFTDQAARDALESDEDNTMVPVNAAGGSIQNAVVPMPTVPTPPEFYTISDQIQQDIDTVSGVSDYMRGAAANIRRTATEAAMIQDAQNARAADKLARIEETLAECGGRLVQLMQQYMTGEHVIRVVGSNRMPVWVNFDKDYIQGEFDFEVEGGSTEPRNESFRRQSALQLVDAMTPFVEGGYVDAMELARHVLQYGFDVKDPSIFLTQPTGPEGQQLPPEQQGMPPEPRLPGMQGPPPMEQMQEQVPGIPDDLLNQLEGFNQAPVNSY